MDAPTGNVTLVFTDIEGSTRLWERYGEGFKATLDAHNAIIRHALSVHNGYEVKTEGDAFFAVFSRPLDAALFCLDVQQGLNALKLKGDDAVRVRIGLYTGEPLVEFDASGRADYFGTAVNRAARISAAGHGGQTLMSSAMAAPLMEILNGRCEFTELGEFRLRGLEEPERITQIVPAGAPIKRFGPLRALADTPTNLPAQTTSFVAREKELRELRAMLLGDEARRVDALGPLESLARQPGVPDTNTVTRDVVSRNRGARLITLTGPGGCGKSRLAAALSASVLPFFPDGVWFADLSDARDEADLCRTVLESLGHQLRPGKATPAQQVAWALEQGQTLLVLDTFEHIAAHAAALTLWLRTAPRLKLIVTSRELLRVEGEAEFAVTPLAAPHIEHRDTATARLSTRISSYPAVQLFLERAAHAKPGFVLTPQNAGAVADICYRLDGMPLALELAAARLSVLSPQQLAARLEKGFDLIASRGRDKKSTRQTNLRNTIEWSYSLLDAWERTAFLQLSYFAGAFTLESAEAVLELSTTLDGGDNAQGDPPEIMDLVFSLRDKSLLSLRGDDERYHFEMLGLIRAFTHERFARVASEEFREQLAERHARHFLERAEAVAKLMDSPMSGAMKDLEGWGMQDAIKAIDYALKSGDLLTSLRLYLATIDLLGRNARFREQREKGEAILAAINSRPGGVTGAERDPKLGKLVPRFFAAHAQASWRSGNYDAGKACAKEGIESAVRMGDIAAEANACMQYGLISHYQEDQKEALRCIERAVQLRRQAGDRKGEAAALVNLSIIYDRMFDFERMRQILQEALNTFAKAHDKRGEALTLNNLGVAYEKLGDLARAEELFRSSLRLKQSLNDRLGMIQSWGNLGTLACSRFNIAQGEEHYLNALDLSRAVGDKRALHHILMRLAGVAIAQGNLRSALERAEEAVQISSEAGDAWSRSFCLSVLAAARSANGDHEGALLTCQELIDDYRPGGLGAQLRLASVQRGDDRRTTLQAIKDRAAGIDSIEGAIWRCLAADELSDSDGRIMRQEALKRPRDWGELIDIACAAHKKLATQTP